VDEGRHLKCEELSGITWRVERKERGGEDVGHQKESFTSMRRGNVKKVMEGR